MLPPGMGFDTCSPASSKKEDAVRGAWKRVERDLNKQIGLYYLYVFYRESVQSLMTHVHQLTSLPQATIAWELRGCHHKYLHPHARPDQR